MNALPLLLCPLLFLLPACDTTKGSGNKVTEDRPVESFTRIRNDSLADVHVTIDSPPSLSVTIDDNLVEMVTTEVRDGMLVVDTDGNFFNTGGMSVNVSVPSLDSAETTSSGDIQIIGLKGTAFTATVSGSGDLIASGEVDSIDASNGGSGTLNLSKLQARTAKATLTKSGDLQINAAESLEAKSSGSGDLKYSGTPTLDSKSTGHGKIMPE